MKTSFLFLFFSLLASYNYGQALTTDWVTSIPGDAFEQNSNMAQSPCGDIYTVGFFQGASFGSLSSAGIEKGFISKYNEQGQLLWLKQLAGNSIDRINSITIGNDNEIYIVGEFRGTFRYNNDSLVSFDELDVLIAKIDSSGNFQWATSLTGWGQESAYDVSISNNGQLIVTGYYENNLTIGAFSLTANNLRDIFIVSIDQQGNPVWLKTLSGPGIEYGRSIAIDSSNNIYVAGAFRDALYPNSATTVYGFGSYDAFLAKYDATGQFLWIKVMGGPSVDEGYYVNIDSKQNPVLVGWYDRSMQIDTFILNGAKEEDGFAVKFSPNGDLTWAFPLAGTFDERVYAVDFDSDDNIYLLGTVDSLLVIGGDSLTNRHLNRPTDIFVIKIDENSNYKWGQTLGHYYNDFCFDLIVHDPTTVYIVGSYQDTSIFVNDTLISQEGYDVFLGRFSMDTTVSIHQISNNSDIATINLYPNPAVQLQSTLEYTLTQSTDVIISVYDLLGQELHKKIFKNQPAGVYHTPIQLPQQASSIYFVRIETKSTTQVLELVSP
ncbi:T9SS type A sorting domain-containing protein [Aureispira sp. CCB-QB1]|uniref:T9SS type A sorting domain-containing protein n=1 Tax=Aureispira sp. CCB-QB1 TaxID=1313421 RepID=UPI000698F83E|nr:T9SS type A sorting domain-containing protein [Aureispira sp. CCB-QB1]